MDDNSILVCPACGFEPVGASAGDTCQGCGDWVFVFDR